MDKQLREAIEKALKEDNQLLDENGYRPIDIGKLLQLFHTYGNRERIEELKNLPKDVHATHGSHTNICVPVQAVRSRIKELNREVES